MDYRFLRFHVHESINRLGPFLSKPWRDSALHRVGVGLLFTKYHTQLVTELFVCWSGISAVLFAYHSTYRRSMPLGGLHDKPFGGNAHELRTGSSIWI